jgi:hypothetical protein
MDYETYYNHVFGPLYQQALKLFLLFGPLNGNDYQIG